MPFNGCPLAFIPRLSLSHSKLFRKPVGDVGPQFELGPAMTDALDHFALRIYGPFIQLYGAPRIHDAIINAVPYEERALDLMGTALEREIRHLCASFLEILSTCEPAKPIPDRRVVVEDVLLQAVRAAPNGAGFEAFLAAHRTRSVVTRHAGPVNRDPIRIDICPRHEVVENSLCVPLRVGRRIDLLQPERPPCPGPSTSKYEIPRARYWPAPLSALSRIPSAPL